MYPYSSEEGLNIFVLLHYVLLNSVQYHANQLLPLKDEQIVAKVMSYLSQCIKDFEEAQVLEYVVTRFPKTVTHYFPGNTKLL